MMCVPAPSTFAPMAFRQLARSSISGSRAAFLISVTPSASTAASMRVFGRAHGGDRELDLGALQAARRLGVDVALVQVDVGAERAQRLQVQVDRPRADRAAAGQAHLGVAGAGEQRAEHVERGAHLADEIVGGEGAGHLRGVQHRLGTRHALALVDVDAQPAKQLRQEPRVGQPGHVGEAQRLVGKQARRHQLDGRVLRPADGDDPLQPGAAGDRNAVHEAPRRARESVRIASVC